MQKYYAEFNDETVKSITRNSVRKMWLFKVYQLPFTAACSVVLSEIVQVHTHVGSEFETAVANMFWGVMSLASRDPKPLISGKYSKNYFISGI